MCTEINVTFPRSRSNHNVGTTETTSPRTRNNRVQTNLDFVDANSFRTHQRGPEFPQHLPQGPVKFLGVIPNEDPGANARNRGRPSQRYPDAIPVVEDTDSYVPHRRPDVSQNRILRKLLNYKHSGVT